MTRREQALSMAFDLMHAAVIKNGLPLARSVQQMGLITECFDLAEKLLDEQERRYPHLKDV